MQKRTAVPPNASKLNAVVRISYGRNKAIAQQIAWSGIDLGAGKMMLSRA
jgi:hypothetical protein